MFLQLTGCNVHVIVSFIITSHYTTLMRSLVIDESEEEEDFIVIVQLHNEITFKS